MTIPSYQFICDNCDHGFDLFQGIKEELPKKCPQCKTKINNGFHQVYAAGIAIVYNSPTTVGQQAEINEKRVGKEQLELMAAHDRKIRKMPEKKKDDSKWAFDDKPLDLKKIKDVRKYVETGDMN